MFANSSSLVLTDKTSGEGFFFKFNAWNTFYLLLFFANLVGFAFCEWSSPTRIVVCEQIGKLLVKDCSACFMFKCIGAFVTGAFAMELFVFLLMRNLKRFRRYNF